jgi:uncharacterized protein (TIGR02265 family)
VGGERYFVDADTALTGDVDLNAILARVPRGATVKGMFLTRFVNAIGEDWEEIEEELEAPPKHGRYTAFDDYPTADYLRLLDRAARNRFPRQSTREAYRLLGRGDVEVFGESTLGKVTFSMIKEPGGALARYPEIIKVLTRGMSTAEATPVGDKRMRLVFARYVGAFEQTVGALEGLVITYDAKPAIEVAIDGERGEFTVSWK